MATPEEGSTGQRYAPGTSDASKTAREPQLGSAKMSVALWISTATSD
jgi:hypothetical protein